jgi:hypothetical protein
MCLINEASFHLSAHKLFTGFVNVKKAPGSKITIPFCKTISGKFFECPFAKLQFNNLAP